MTRQELNNLISKNIVFYNEVKNRMSGLFLSFVNEYCRILTQKYDFQYILVPNNCHDEFQLYLEKKEKFIYQDPQHYHYIDPSINKPFFQFCQIHSILDMCYKIQSYPQHKPIPINLVIEEVKSQCIPTEMFHLLLDSFEPSCLPFVLPMTQKKDAIHTAKLLLKNSQKFPLYIDHVFITNWLVQQGCSLEMLNTMWNNGFPPKFPIRLEDNQQQLYSIDEKIIGLFFTKCTTQYPFHLPIDNVIMNSSYKEDVHFPIVYHSIKNGHSPSIAGFSVLLKKTDLTDKDLYFTDYVIQKLKNDEFDIDIWSEFGWQENQDRIIELIMTFCKQETQTFMVIHLCMNMMDIIYADMEYWVLKFQDLFPRYLQFIHLVKFCKRNETTIRNIDQRIINHLKPKDSMESPPINYPPFYERHEKMIIFHDQNDEKIEIPVYFSFLSSGLLSRISTPNGFRPSLNPNKEIIELDFGLPNLFRDQKKIMCDWIMYSYLKIVPPHCSIEDVVEMYYLSQYLIDNVCERKTKQWLEDKYIRDFEIHTKHDKKQECLLCSFWQQSG